MIMIINAETASFCYLDLDFNNHRRKLAAAAAFVNATDSRYGFSSKDLRRLGGSELKRIPELVASDHEWNTSRIELIPLDCGNRLVVQLYWDVAPLACENFATLCANGSSDKKVPLGESGKPLTYRQSTVHRVVPGFVMQGGDILFGNGSGGESVFGGKKCFKDERSGLALKHNRRGLLSMGNSGKNSNTSQWFITFGQAPQCDGKHVIFGELVSGWEVLERAEQYGTLSGDPTEPITVTDCGLWTPFETPGSGYWFDKPDKEAYSGISPVFMVRPRVAVVAPNSAVLERFQKALGTQCTTTPVLVDEQVETSIALEKLERLLSTFAVDIILVAPACNAAQSLRLPDSWTATNKIQRQHVVLEAKPVDALMTIHSKSWLTAAGWPLDGSFS